jgi:hypothetical protein
VLGRTRFRSKEAHEIGNGVSVLRRREPGQLNARDADESFRPPRFEGIELVVNILGDSPGLLAHAVVGVVFGHRALDHACQLSDGVLAV